MASELDIIVQDMHDYKDKVANRLKQHSGLEFSRDLVYHQVKDYLDRKVSQNILKSYSLHWFNSWVLVLNLTMTQTPISSRHGSSFTISFPHLKASDLLTAVERYNRAMKGI